MVDDPGENLVESDLRFVPDQVADLRQVRHAARHVLEPGLVGLIVRNLHDLGSPAGEVANPFSQLEDRDFLIVADVEDLTDGPRLGDQAL